jgi:hypothetical protein
VEVYDIGLPKFVSMISFYFRTPLSVLFVVGLPWYLDGYSFENMCTIFFSSAWALFGASQKSIGCLLTNIYSNNSR